MEEKTPELSEREQEILRLIATGASNKEIAHKLVISPNTVKVHVRNIFGKIGAASRTEAAMYAVREGMVPSSSVHSSEEGNSNSQSFIDASVIDGNGIGKTGVFPQTPGINKNRLLIRSLSYAVVVIILLTFITIWNGLKANDDPGNRETSKLQEWKELAPLSEGRQRLAVASLENNIYAIAGETAENVVGSVEIYSIPDDSWSVGSEKLTPVSEVGAVVIGGLIYVPGGKLSSGDVTDVLEVYDPHNNLWKRRASLPIALCGYALAAFEGRLYLFGGWDGDEYLDTVFSYDPATDKWSSLPSMPTRRAYAGASSASGKIYVLGGINEEGSLSVNEVFTPGASQDQSWSSAKELPENRYQMGLTSIADFIYVVGGLSKEGSSSQTSSFQYIPANDDWHSFDSPFDVGWSGIGVTSQNTHIYAIGGFTDNNVINSLYSYEAIFVIQLPIVR